MTANYGTELARAGTLGFVTGSSLDGRAPNAAAMRASGGKGIKHYWLALAVQPAFRGRTLFRVGFFLPSVVSVVVLAAGSPWGWRDELFLPLRAAGSSTGRRRGAWCRRWSTRRSSGSRSGS